MAIEADLLAAVPAFPRESEQIPEYAAMPTARS